VHAAIADVGEEIRSLSNSRMKAASALLRRRRRSRAVSVTVKRAL